MTTVRLEGFTAPERDAGVWSSVRVERAAGFAGPWPGTVLLSEPVPVYADPGRPPTLSWTVDDPDGVGWYRVVWSAGGEDAPAPAVSGGAWDPNWPTVGEVALILRARLVELGGRRVDSFTADTEPSAEEVGALIALYGPLMLGGLGDLSGLACASASTLRGAARVLVASRVAAEIELSYRPEEVGESAAAATAERRASLDADLTRLSAAVVECRAQGSPDPTDPTSRGPGDAAWNFPRRVYLNW